MTVSSIFNGASHGSTHSHKPLVAAGLRVLSPSTSAARAINTGLPDAT